jgi:NADH-quinone oxidoreductase subunit G
VRKAANRGAGVHFVNPVRFSHLFPEGVWLEGTPEDFWRELGGIVRAALGDAAPAGGALASALEGAPTPSAAHAEVAARLKAGQRSAVILGQISLRHPRLAELQVLAAELGRLTGSAVGCITEGANAAGLALAGCLPHREAGGRPRARPGRTAAEVLAAAPACLVLFNVEPGEDCIAGQGAGFTIAFSPFAGEALRNSADLILPIGTFAETDGTFVNLEGRWQSFEAVARPHGEARPGWKVLRVLGNRLGVTSFDFPTAAAIRDAARAEGAAVAAAAPGELEPARARTTTLEELDVPMYRVDALVRRSPALQAAATNQPAAPNARRRSA